MLRATHGHLASKNENKRQKKLTVVQSHDRGHSGQGGLVLVCWAVCFNTQELVWWLYTHTRMHTNCIHATLTQTHAPTHAHNTHKYTRSHARTQHSHARTQHSQAHTHACMHTLVHHTTNTHSHAQVLNLHVHAHTSGPDRHIHNQVIPAHGLEPCRACVNLCLSDLFPMRTDRWDPQGMWSI